jgi:two-component system chemotaxis sensor kinase CheA
MEDFERELKIGFLEEAETAVQDVEQCFLALEKNSGDLDNLNKIFRLAHNLKGSSKAVGFDAFGAFTHRFESFILRVKNGELQATPKVVGLLLRANDHVMVMIRGLKENLDAQFDSQALIDEMDNYSEVGGIESVASPHSEEKSEEKSVESPANAIEVAAPAVNVAEVALPEITVKPQEVQYEVPEKKEAKQVTKTSASDESIRVSIGKIAKLINFVGEMVILQSVLREQAASTESLLLKKAVQQLGKVGKEIQDISMSLRMVPVKPTFQKMQRIVRDTSAALNKEINMHLVGEDTELDKTVLELINDPLVHLVRNSIDHGIEKAELRTQRGKNPVGQVTLIAEQQAGKLVLQVKDDGGGLDAEKLKSIAIKKGILSSSAQLTEKEAWNLIFAPGFSTKEQVTDVSGRGVGMDVVKTNITELGGEIHIDSQLGKGTTFKIFLPLSMSIIDAMVITYSQHRFVLPLTHVFETLRPEKQHVQENTNMGQTLLLRGENLPIVRLGDFFGIQSHTPIEDMIAMVIKSTTHPFAIVVDDIIGQFQVVLKPLSPELEGIKGISGTTILGDGRPALILEPSELLKRKIGSSFSPPKSTSKDLQNESKKGLAA